MKITAGGGRMGGSTSPGIVVVMLAVIGLVAWLSYSGHGDILAGWSSWPWWAKALIIGLLVLVFAGGSLWSACDWPKRPPPGND
ncbi:MAG: hypothetical protein OEN20_00090 [Gammaproteobacteria bacterium]|nr:hypothetical protein [Gammaproteobacteria bacterium]